MVLWQASLQQSLEAMDVVFEPLIDAFRPFFMKLSLVMGGIFGLYFILIVIRVYYERKKVRIMQDIRYDLDRMNMSHGLPYSREKKGLFRRLIAKIKIWWVHKSYQRHLKKHKKK